MLIECCNWFTKITAWPVQKLCFRTKIYYEEPGGQGRRIKGPAILVSNHTSVFDYAVYLFVFFSRTLRFQMAEILFEKKVLGLFLKGMGGIRVDRNAYDFGFITKSEEVLRRGGVVGVFPEGRIPLKEESRPLEFKTSAAYLALASGVPVIPVYTNGSYFSKKRARVMVGTPVDLSQYTDPECTEKENLTRVTAVMRERIIELEAKLNERIEGAAKGAAV